jgi:hypothetical protein
MAETAKRVTFRLRRATVDAIDALVRSGAARSRNALIEDLVSQAARSLRRREREAEAEKFYARAFADAAYTAEQEEVVRAFAVADAEAARSIDR